MINQAIQQAFDDKLNVLLILIKIKHVLDLTKLFLIINFEKKFIPNEDNFVKYFFYEKEIFNASNKNCLLQEERTT